jgi:formylglycine-generating enzyme required for sulfatase activity
MKYIVCSITMLFLVFGCKKKNSPNAMPTPDLKTGETFTNSIGMKLVYIPPGEFMMGSRDSAAEVARKVRNAKSGYFTPEHPQHRVKITNGFYMGTTEVTQFQYEEIMNNNPSHFRGEEYPVETVSWNDAVEFCKRLSEKEGKTYRLPTEAEWEYACRAGTTTPFYTGETISTSQANYCGNYVYGNGTKGIYRKQTMPVGSFSANDFGLYNMHGNVWEWCQDFYEANYYANSPITDPQGPSSGTFRVVRGGFWYFSPGFCRSAARAWFTPDKRANTRGFRILQVLN